MGNVISNEDAQKICKPGTEECCRYLTMTASGWECAKNTALKGILDARVGAGTMRATGDNCDGR